jgi:hypothetical protein
LIGTGQKSWTMAQSIQTWGLDWASLHLTHSKKLSHPKGAYWGYFMLGPPKINFSLSLHPHLMIEKVHLMSF